MTFIESAFDGRRQRANKTCEQTKWKIQNFRFQRSLLNRTHCYNLHPYKLAATYKLLNEWETVFSLFLLFCHYTLYISRKICRYVYVCSCVCVSNDTSMLLNACTYRGKRNTSTIIDIHTHTNANAWAIFSALHMHNALVDTVKKDRNTAWCVYSHRFISVMPKRCERGIHIVVLAVNWFVGNIWNSQ